MSKHWRITKFDRKLCKLYSGSGLKTEKVYIQMLTLIKFHVFQLPSTCITFYVFSFEVFFLFNEKINWNRYFKQLLRFPLLTREVYFKEVKISIYKWKKRKQFDIWTSELFSNSLPKDKRVNSSKKYFMNHFTCSSFAYTHMLWTFTWITKWMGC